MPKTKLTDEQLEELGGLDQFPKDLFDTVTEQTFNDKMDAVKYEVFQRLRIILFTAPPANQIAAAKELLKWSYSADKKYKPDEIDVDVGEIELPQEETR